jgi:hypothetical protein
MSVSLVVRLTDALRIMFSAPRFYQGLVRGANVPRPTIALPAANS